MIVGLVVASLAMLVTSLTSDRPAFKRVAELNFLPTAPLQVMPASGAGDAEVRFRRLQGTLMLTAAASPELTSLVQWNALLEFIVVGAFGVAVVHLLWRVCQQIERGEIFTDLTFARVRMLGGLMTIGSCVVSAAQSWMNYRIGMYVERKISFTGLAFEASGQPSRFTGTFVDILRHGTFDADSFFTGLIILVMAEVFRRGLALQRDNDLTV
jgi:hypothetical protein